MKINKYETLEDLLADASFKQWATGKAGDHVSFWENWLIENPDKKKLVEKATAIIEGIPFAIKEKPVDPRLVKEEWKKQRSRTLEAGVDFRKRQDIRRLWGGAWQLRAAASLGLLIAFAFAIQYYVFNPVVEYRTPFGKHINLVLPDSTSVELNANSVLSYRKQNPRKVWLDGEAFFKVKKKPVTGANFLVLTNDLTVEVLGTAFNVIEKENQTEVILEEGRVKLNLKRDFEQEVLMNPGELVAFSVQTIEKVDKRQVKPEVLTSWKDGVQEFEDVTLTEVMKRIQEIYGWEAIFFNEELKTRKISIGLPSEDFESALLLLSKTMNMRIEKIEKEGKTLLLY